MQEIKNKVYSLLRWSEKYTKTDMLYLAKGGLWLTIGNIIVIILGFLLSIAFAHLLSKSDYGNYKYILSLSGVIGAFTLTGLGTAVIRTVAQGYEGIIRYGFKVKLKWGSFIFLAGLVLSTYYYVNDNILLSSTLLVAGVLLPLISSFSIYGSFLQGKKDFQTDSILNIIRNLIPTISLLLVLFFTKNVFLLILTYFTTHTITSGLLYGYSLKKFKPNKNVSSTDISYSKHLSLMNILGSIAIHIDKILIFHYLGAVELAIYAFATLIPEQIKNLIKGMESLALPKFAEKNYNNLQESIYRKSLRFLLLISVIVLTYVLCAPFVYNFIFPQYTESILYSQIYSISLLAGISVIPTAALKAHAKKQKLYIFNIYSAVTQILLLLIFTNIWGLMGAILSRVIVRLSSLFVVLFLVKS